MAKMKTHSATKKRFWVTGGGKIKRTKAYRRHHAWSKNSKKIQQLRGSVYVDDTSYANIKRLLPYQ